MLNLIFIISSHIEEKQSWHLMRLYFTADDKRTNQLNLFTEDDQSKSHVTLKVCRVYNAPSASIAGEKRNGELKF